MTRADLLPYWAAAAQIIPVLALAFVIEARILIRSFSKKKTFRHRASRVRWAAVLFVVATLLAVGQLGALQALTRGGSKPLTALDQFYYVVSWAGMYGALLIVLTIPISNLIVASTGDVRIWVRTHLPWGKAQRLRRRITRDIADLEQSQRKLRQSRFEAVVFGADTLLHPLPRDEASTLLEQVLDDMPHRDAEMNAEFRQLLAKADDDNLGWAAARIIRQAMDEQLERTSDLIEQFRRSLEEVNRMINTLPPDAEKALRSLMVDVAKIN